MHQSVGLNIFPFFCYLLQPLIPLSLVSLSHSCPVSGCCCLIKRTLKLKHPRGETIYDHCRLNFLSVTHCVCFCVCFHACSLCASEKRWGWCFTWWGDNMVFSLCYRLISLEDQTTNSECMKKPHQPFSPQKQLRCSQSVWYLLLGAIWPPCHQAPYQGHKGTSHVNILSICLSYWNQSYMFTGTVLSEVGPLTSISICFTVDLHKESNQR